jgi:hypothetical protein
MAGKYHPEWRRDSADKGTLTDQEIGGLPLGTAAQRVCLGVRGLM